MCFSKGRCDVLPQSPEGWRFGSVCAALGTTLPVSVREPAGLAVSTIVLIVAMVLLTPVVNRSIRHLTKRIFQQPDFDGELHQLEDAFSQMTSESDVFQRAESTLIRLFGFVDAHIAGDGNLSPALQCELAAHDVLEFRSGSCTVPCDRLEADALLAVRQNRRLTHAVAIVRSRDQRGFLASEVSFLTGLAGRLASRLETMRVERDNYERDRREATLRHQNAEAELQALRAQINPHFLFNALNTIADLIVMDAHKAERMTERLSDVFRYILTHSQTATSTVEQEIDYVRR
jgi:two-component system, LytTR family, sensor kinase